MGKLKSVLEQYLERRKGRGSSWDQSDFEDTRKAIEALAADEAEVETLRKKVSDLERRLAEVERFIRS